VTTRNIIIKDIDVKNGEYKDGRNVFIFKKNNYAALLMVNYISCHHFLYPSPNGRLF
jgi:hypothetical protein